MRADLRGEVYDRMGEVVRDRRSLAVCAFHAAAVAATLAAIDAALPAMAAAGIVPTYRTVSKALTDRGHPIDQRSLRRREEYRHRILAFHAIEPPSRLHDPERERLSRLSAEELGAMVVRLRATLRPLEAEFAATLSG